MQVYTIFQYLFHRDINSRTKLTITNVNENITLSTTFSKAYKIGGKLLYLCVKGSASTEIVNQMLFSVQSSGQVLSSSTVIIGIGTDWNIDSAGYAYISTDGNDAFVTARIPANKWFHINILLPLA